MLKAFFSHNFSLIKYISTWWFNPILQETCKYPSGHEQTDSIVCCEGVHDIRRPAVAIGGRLVFATSLPRYEFTGIFHLVLSTSCIVEESRSRERFQLFLKRGCPPSLCSRGIVGCKGGGTQTIPYTQNKRQSVQCTRLAAPKNRRSSEDHAR